MVVQQECTSRGEYGSEHARRGMVIATSVPRTHLDQQDDQAYRHLDRCGPHCTALRCQQPRLIGSPCTREGTRGPTPAVRGRKRGIERLTGVLVKSTCSGTMHTNSSVRHDTHSLERTSENITHEPLRAGVDTGDLGTPQSVLSGGCTQTDQAITHIRRNMGHEGRVGQRRASLSGQTHAALVYRAGQRCSGEQSRGHGAPEKLRTVSLASCLGCRSHGGKHT